MSRPTLWFVVCAVLVPPAAAARQSELVIVKEGTKVYHRPGCPVIRDGKNVVAMTRAQAAARGLESHQDCEPGKSAPPGDSVRPVPPVDVYTDGGKYYHRESCKKLGKNRTKTKLEAAGKKYWPCPVCRPPIRKRGS